MSDQTKTYLMWLSHLLVALLPQMTATYSSSCSDGAGYHRMINIPNKDLEASTEEQSTISLM